MRFSRFFRLYRLSESVTYVCSIPCNTPTPPASTIFTLLFSIGWRVRFPLATSAYPSCAFGLQKRRYYIPLIDNTARTDLRLRCENESTFDFMNVSARPGIVAVCGLLQGWPTEVPRQYPSRP